MDVIKIIIVLVLLSSCNNDKKTKVPVGEVSSLGNKKEVNIIDCSDSIIFPLMQSINEMKALRNDDVERFTFEIDRNDTLTKEGIFFSKIMFSTPRDHRDKSFFLGIRNDSLYTTETLRKSDPINYLFSFLEDKKREIGKSVIDKSYLLSIEKPIVQESETVFKIKFKYNFFPYPAKNKDGSFSEYKPNWEIKEMWFTQCRGSIKAIVKNNKNNLNYVALPNN